MNREMLHRVKTAGEYQKKAVRALFPESMNGHLDVIEAEVKAMVLEWVSEMSQECKRKDSREKGQQGEASGVKKVPIL